MFLTKPFNSPNYSLSFFSLVYLIISTIRIILSLINGNVVVGTFVVCIRKRVPLILNYGEASVNEDAAAAATRIFNIATQIAKHSIEHST